MNRHTACDVYQCRKLIDTVFFTPSKGQTKAEIAEEVRRSLVNHDGYAPDIAVRVSRRLPRPATVTHPPKGPHAMKLTLTIRMDNAAFGEDGDTRATEAARILRDAAARLEMAGAYERGPLFALRDANGNTVGEVKLSA